MERPSIIQQINFTTTNLNYISNNNVLKDKCIKFCTENWELIEGSNLSRIYDLKEILIEL